MSSERMTCAHVFWMPGVSPAMTRGDVAVPLPLVEVQHLALTMASGYVLVDSLAATSVLT